MPPHGGVRGLRAERGPTGGGDVEQGAAALAAEPRVERWLALLVGTAAFFCFLEMFRQRLGARFAGAAYVGGQLDIGLLRRGLRRQRSRGRRRFGRGGGQLCQADRRRGLGDRSRFQRFFAQFGRLFHLRGIEDRRFARDAGGRNVAFASVPRGRGRHGSGGAEDAPAAACSPAARVLPPRYSFRRATSLSSKLASAEPLPVMPARVQMSTSSLLSIFSSLASE